MDDLSSVNQLEKFDLYFHSFQSFTFQSKNRWFYNIALKFI